MMEEFETTRGRQVDVHYMNAGIPRTIEENLEGYYYLDHEDLPLEEILQDQEILYQSFQTNTENDTAEASESSHTSSNTDRSDSEIVQNEGEYSQANDVAAQIALDEALARTMQEMENHEFAGTSITETAWTAAETTASPSSPIIGESSSTDTTSTVVSREDEIDPDNMTYEELEALGEAIGTHSRGLSDELISYLPTFKYKTGMFSKTDKHECVICLRAYKKRDIVMTLPCQHPFHSDCISQWLNLNKVCLYKPPMRWFGSPDWCFFPAAATEQLDSLADASSWMYFFQVYIFSHPKASLKGWKIAGPFGFWAVAHTWMSPLIGP